MAIDRIERKYATLPIDEVEADGTFCGYASLFGEVDLGRDRVEPGAFSRSLKKRGVSGIRMLFQHNPADPIGRWETIREDKRGLFVRGRLAKGVGKAGEVLQLMRAGALDGLSIGFRTIRSRTEAGTGVRRILEADLWEVSVVTFPMLPGARVAAVKSLTGRTARPTKRQFERWLTRDAGLTRGQAKAFLAKGYAGIKSRRDAEPYSTAGLTERLRRAATLFRQRS